MTPRGQFSMARDICTVTRGIIATHRENIEGVELHLVVVLAGVQSVCF
jgi:hypothetical protein